jgi:hypothetical protein
MEASIGELLVSILVQFEIGEFESEKNPPRHEPIKLSDLSLVKKAMEQWGIAIKQVPDGTCRCHADFDKERNEIQLIESNVKSFLHGLAHAAIDRLSGTITLKQHHWQEIMAELASCALFEILMNQSDEKLSNSYSVIVFNSVALNVTPMEACIEVFAETEEIIEFILA